MLFHYLAVNEEGGKTESDFEAGTLNDVLTYLSSRNLQPISVKPAKKGGFALPRLWGSKITTSDKVFLTKYLALMLRVGTDLLSAINILIADFDKPAVREFLMEVHENLTRGQPFYMAFAKRPKTFSPTFVNLIKAAEASGNLQKTFEDLSASLEDEAELRSSVRSALIYPAVVLTLAGGIMVFLVTFALPKLANVFTSSDVTPPAFSQIVFAVGLFIGQNIIVIGLIVLAAVGVSVWAVVKTATGKRVYERVVMSLPVVRGIYSDLAVQRMASTMSSLMKAGLPIMDTIKVAADTVGHREFQYALRRVADEGLAKGLTIGESFKRESVFPKSVTNLIAISEKAGHLEEVLGTLSDFYAANLKSNIKALVSLLEPAMILGMGIMVAVIALSVIVPIYQLTTSF